MLGSKNRVFAESLGDVGASPELPPRANRLGMGVLTGRSNRLADLATGAVVSRTHELVDPARCRMWSGHNREYGALSEERCSDLIESFKAQGRQEVPALVRRVRESEEFDYEVICGARRHWAASWLRAHNYPDFRFLIEVRDLTDEEAFRLADLENRARADISDLERARDYVRALDAYYEGSQSSMAQRLNVSPSWLSRYLDLARLPKELVAAFGNPHDLGIKHVTMIKPLLKPSDRKQRVMAEAERLAVLRLSGGAAFGSIPEIIRLLAAAADPPKKTGSPKRSGTAQSTIHSSSGKPLINVERKGRGGLALFLHAKSGATREEVDAALTAVINEHWT